MQERQEITERIQRAPRLLSSKMPPSTFYKRIMTDPVKNAKTLLGWSDDDGKLNTVNIKRVFHASIRKCHPDKGGTGIDVTSIINARDFLLANVSVTHQECEIQNCSEASIKNGRCNFHANYK